MSKTINQALGDLVTGLGESSSILSDNSTVSDYIADVEKAIKDYAGSTAEAIIDDSEASETKTYSSSKIESLIPADELPAVTSADNGKLLGVSSGAWSAVENNVIVIPATLTYNSETSKWSIAPDQEATMKKSDEIFNAIVANKVVRIYAKDGNNGHVFDILDYNTQTKNFGFRELITSGTALTIRYFTLSGYAPTNFSGVLTVKNITFDT